VVFHSGTRAARRAVAAVMAGMLLGLLALSLSALHPADAATLGQAAVPAPTATQRPDGGFRPYQASREVGEAIRGAVARYNLPRWFYYAIVQRESSFDPNADTGTDFGLTQLAGDWYAGMPYPHGLRAPDDAHPQWGWDMNFERFGAWNRMSDVSRLRDSFDPEQNLDRFSTAYAVPAFHLIKRLHGLDDEETLRIVAFHWNKGLFVPYDPDNRDYLALYDQYVDYFKFYVEREDGAWNGEPSIPGARPTPTPAR